MCAVCNHTQPSHIVMMFSVIFIFEILILCLICRCQAYLLALAVRAACSPESLLERYLAILHWSMPCRWTGKLLWLRYGFCSRWVDVRSCQINLTQPSTWNNSLFLGLFIGFHFEVGVVLPVGIRRGSCNRIQVENANAKGPLVKLLDRRLEWLRVIRPLAAIHLPMRASWGFVTCHGNQWYSGTASHVKERLLTMGRPFRYQRDVARAARAFLWMSRSMLSFLAVQLW